MPVLRCGGCKASLRPQDKSVQFITCEYCRATIKNPKFREVPPVSQHQNINQGARANVQQPGNVGQPSDAQILGSLIPALMSGRPRRRFRRRRRGGCGYGCGCGCLVIIIVIFLSLGLITFILEVGFDELLNLIEQLIN